MDYTLDLTANIDGFKKNIQEASNELAELGDQSIKTGKETQKAFETKGGAEKFQENLKEQFIQLGKFQVELNKLKSALKSAFEPKVVQDITNKINETQKSINGLSSTIENSEDSTVSLTQRLKENNEILEQMRGLSLQNTDAYKELSDVTKVLSQETEILDKTTNRLRTQILQNKNALAEMARNGKGATDEFRLLEEETARLQNQITETDKRIKILASDTRGIQGFIAIAKTGAATLSLLEGSAALFGVRNEEIQKSLLKVNAAMAILNGLEEISKSLKKESTARLAIDNILHKARVFILGQETKAVNTLTVAEKASAAAGKALRATLIASGIGIVIGLIGLLASIMSDFASNTETATDKIKEQDQALENLTDRFKFLTDVQIAEAERARATSSQLRGIEKQGYRERIGLLERDVEDKKALYNKQKSVLNTILRIGTDEQKKLYKEQLKATEVALMESQNNLIDLRRDFIVFNKNADTQAVKEDAALLAINNSNRIAAMKDGQAKELAAIDEARRLELESAVENNADRLLIEAKFQRQKTEVILKYERERTAANNANRISALADGYERDRALLEENQRKERESAIKQGLNIRDLEANFSKERIDLDQKYIKAGRDAAEAATEEENARRKKEQDDILEARFDFTNDIEQIKLLELDIEYESGSKSIVQAQRIAEEKLKIEIEYAEKRLAILKESNSAAVNDLAIKNIEKGIAAAKSQLKELGRNSSNADFLKAVGLGDITEVQLQSLKDSVSTIVDSVKSILSNMVQSSIDANRQTIENLDEQIEKTKSTVKEEQDLADEGRSNNLKREQENLARLEGERRAAFEKDKKLQRQKLNIDATSQLSSLITAAAKIYESYASLPYYGQVLAAASIAAMFAAFASNQITARQSINRQTLGKGGLVEGKYHDADGLGGERYISQDGNSIKYIEKDEYVVNRKSVRKYLPLIEAINKDNFAGIHGLLRNTGVVMSQDKVDSFKASKEIFADRELRYRIEIENGMSTKEVAELRKDFNAFTKNLDSKPDITYSGGWKIEKRGNRTIRTKQ